MNARSASAVALGAVLLLVGGFYGSFYAVPGPWHPCDEPLVADHPAAEFAFEERSDGTINITHAGGDTMDPTNGQALVVRLVDAETGASGETVWTNGSVGGRVGHGDDLVLSPYRLMNGSLTAGDEIRVVWEATERDIPPVCPNYAPADTDTLAIHTVQEVPTASEG